MAEAYESNIEDLKYELEGDKESTRQNQGEKESPSTLMEFTQFLEPYQGVFFPPKLFRLCKIAVLSRASCEQSFSSLRLVKTEKRRLSLALLSIESKRTKALDLDRFVKHFAEQHGNRRIQLLQQCQVMLTGGAFSKLFFLYLYVPVSSFIKPQALGREKCKM